MKLTEFMIIIIAALIFLVPTMKKEKSYQERETQEEETILEQKDKTKYQTIKIKYVAQTPNEEPIIDIIWIKKAAQKASEAGIPYFNILDQHISKRFVRRYNMELSTIEGVIQLDNDPMEAEYDAQEIENLILSNAPSF